ncbi:MAG: hypothetical protein ACRDYA_23580 [Egibacteraceae bacterium]
MDADSQPLSTVTDYPVKARPIIQFTWLTGDWFEVFQKQVALIQSDIARAQAEDRIIVYLSCPISSRGGGHFLTNTEIASFVTRRLLDKWGERFFILNPAAYQLESREGTGLITRHIAELSRQTGRSITLEQLLRTARPGGGDYMRMWTRVLVEDDYLNDAPGRSRCGSHLGGLFDAFYFVGSSDMHEFFFDSGRGSITSTVESYFARKYAIDPAFRADFEMTTEDTQRRLLDLTNDTDTAVWESRRKAFFRYYAVRAGASYSLGSHDEWNIFVRLNQARAGHPQYGPGEQITGFFDGRQLTLADSEQQTSPGYEETGAQLPGPANSTNVSKPSVSSCGEAGHSR